MFPKPAHFAYRFEPVTDTIEARTRVVTGWRTCCAGHSRLSPKARVRTQGENALSEGYQIRLLDEVAQMNQDPLYTTNRSVFDATALAHGRPGLLYFPTLNFEPHNESGR